MLNYNYVLSFLLITVPSISYACQPISSSSGGSWTLIAIISIGVVVLLLLSSYIQLYRHGEVIFSKTISTLFKVNIIVFIASFLWLTVGLYFFIWAGLIQGGLLPTCETIYSPFFYKYIHLFIDAVLSVSSCILIVSVVLMIIKKISSLKSQK